MEDNIIALIQYGPGYVIAMAAIVAMGQALRDQRLAQERVTSLLMDIISKLCKRDD